MVSLRSIHYGWIIVLSGMLTLIAVLGLGRFSLGMLLPSMGKDLELAYSQMGYIGTGNFIGYLLGVLVSSRMVKRFGYRSIISSGIFLVGGSMICVEPCNASSEAITSLPRVIAVVLISLLICASQDGS